MNNLKRRRLFLKSTLAAGTIGVAAAAGLLTPGMVLAELPASAFAAKSVEDAVSNLLGGAAAASDKVVVKVADIAENGATVPVTIETQLENIENISLLVSENNNPLVAAFNMSPEMDGTVSIRAKVGKSSDIVGVVKAGGKLYSGKKGVKVTKGGC